MMNHKLLLINDLAGYGKVALSAMIPVLLHMKYEIFSLPTAIVSNTLDYGKFDILDTTDEYMNIRLIYGINWVLPLRRYQLSLLFQKNRQN